MGTFEFSDKGMRDLEKRITKNLNEKWAPAMTAEAARLVGQPVAEVKAGLSRVSKANGVTPGAELEKWAARVSGGTAIEFTAKTK